MNKNTFRHIICLLMLIIFGNTSFAQDPIFSQILKNNTYLNPANSFNALADNSKLKFDFQYRDQWDNVEVGDNYSTSKVNADYNFYKSQVDSWNAGLLFVSDRSNSGYLKQTSFQLFTAYSRKLGGAGRGHAYSSMLTFGASLGFGQTNIDLSNLWFGRQYDLATLSVDNSINSGEPTNVDNTSFLDINLGGRFVKYTGEDTYLSGGLSLSHVNEPQLHQSNTNLTLAPRLTAQFDAQLPLGKSLFHKPGITFVQQDWALQIVPSYLLSFDLDHPEEDFTLISGISSRIVNGLDATIMDAFIIHLGISSSKWHLYFSFDINTSTLRPATNGVGALELGMGYNIVSDR